MKSVHTSWFKGVLALGTIIAVLMIGSVVVQTVSAYSGGVPCGKLSGVPGLLQTAGFLPSGTCATTNDGRTCSAPGSPCKFSNGNPSPGGEDKKNGTCRQLPANGPCQCKPDGGS